MNAMLKAAQFYHNEGLCVIPVKPRAKAPALATWERYQTEPSTAAEIVEWFDGRSQFNVGIVHGEVSNNYVSIDIDHDAGLFARLEQRFPELFEGRIEQSGSHEGYHIPLRLSELPDFGMDSRQERPRGNKTWKTELGDCNLRIRFCQTVAPPSIHPSGNRYRFIKKGQLNELTNLDDLIGWLNKHAPPPRPRKVNPNNAPRTIRATDKANLVDAVKDAWPDALTVFKEFNLARDISRERNGETRIHDNGGLLIHAEDPGLWYCFSDEIGGDVIVAWGWCRYGSAYDPQRHFRTVLVEMAQAAGIDVAQFYRKGDEQTKTQFAGDRQYWTDKYTGRWQQMRTVQG